MSNLVMAFILFVTVLAAMALGIVTAYGAINGVLYAFARRTRQASAPASSLAGQSAVAGGD